MSPTLPIAALFATISQVPTEPASEAANRASLERMVADLSDLDVSLAVEPPEAIAFRRAPVLRWNNLIRNVDAAAVFVGLSAERPELVATVMSYRDAGNNPRRAYELLSLSARPVEAFQDGARVWRCEHAGLEWQSVPNAPLPAETPAERRRQMRELAAAFQAAAESDRNRYELRLLSQPLCRYQKPASGILDGALFAFVEGTDPELILVIESPRDNPGWKFTAGRLTRWAIELRYGGRLMSEFPQISGTGGTSDVYWITDAGPLDSGSPPQPASPGSR